MPIYDLGGTLRAYTPEETLKKLRPLLLDVFGITRVADITGLDNIGIPVSVCIRPNARIMSTSQGKGITPELAEISAIMESLESWHAERISSERIYSSYQQLSQHYPLPLLEHLVRSHVSYPDVLNRELPWLQVTDLMQQQTTFLPYALISLDSASYHPQQELFIGTSNGLAAGNTKEEAICHGLYESIERDCRAQFERSTEEDKALRRVRIDTIDSLHNQTLIEKIYQANIKLYIFEITNRFGIASFAVHIDDPYALRGLGCFGGYGTHLSREVALSRAICEAVQSRLTFIVGSREDIFSWSYKNKAVRHLNYPDTEYVDFTDTPHDKPSDFDACISILLQKLKQQAINHVLLYDHTHLELNIPVVSVVVPELDFDWKSHRMVV